MTIARPYPETIEALQCRISDLVRQVDALVASRGSYLARIAALDDRLREAEHEIEAKRLRIQGLLQTIEQQAKQDGERIAALEAENKRLWVTLDDWERRLDRIAALVEALPDKVMDAYRAVSGDTSQQDLPPTRAEELSRCEITGNPVGTDTWRVGCSCRCARCQAYLDGLTTRAEESTLSPTWLEAERDVDANEDRD